ncbi:MAG: RNA methyltransferase [Kouleothrix sp.]|nr:RNA methyltransferase [Kouleothrix sp.]
MNRTKPELQIRPHAMNDHNPLDAIVVVLHRPRKLVNIAGAVRAMKNMGLHRLRLVQPAEYNAYEIEGIAHRSADVLSATSIHATLDDALADAIFVAGTTARMREAGPPAATPRALAPGLLARAADGPVALLFGPEDNGLTNPELDRCHALLSIPADPAYPSLNLAQAVLLVAYELRMAGDLATPAPRRARQPAAAAQLEDLFGAIERALWGVEFFKSHQAEAMLRTLRSLTHRAEPEVREAALLKAMALETLNFLRRKGVAPGLRPAEPGATRSIHGRQDHEGHADREANT